MPAFYAYLLSHRFEIPSGCCTRVHRARRNLQVEAEAEGEEEQSREDDDESSRALLQSICNRSRKQQAVYGCSSLASPYFPFPQNASRRIKI